MKKTLRIVSLLFVMFALAAGAFAYASAIISNAEATALLQKQNKSDEEYEKLGEWWMEQMMGEQHEAMDAAVEKTHGSAFLDAMHITMGKRLAGETSWNAMPMMQMMSGWPYGETRGMMRGNMMPYWWNGIGSFAAISMFLWAIALPLGLTILVILFILRFWKQ